MKIFTSTPEEVAAELVDNFKRGGHHLLIMGTVDEVGRLHMRLGLTSEAQVIAIITEQASQTGDPKTAIEMCDRLVRIGQAAKILIQQELIKKARNN